MKIKVCGMKYPENIKAVLPLGIDFMGFIFYPKSVRYFEGDLSGIDFKQTKKVGVFVDESFSLLLQKACFYELDYIQLHGQESPEYAEKIKKQGFKIIKVFKLDKDFDFTICKDFLAISDLFLFDTKGKLPGGNGEQFDWRVLEKYDLNKPFLLSGGIGLAHASQVKNFKHPQCVGVDVNSGFEIEPGLKNVVILSRFIRQLSATR